MSNYSRGATLERQTIHYLTNNGYWCIRAAQSKGTADVCALKPGEVLLVSCKITALPPPAERIALASLARHVGAVPILARRGPRGHGGPLLQRITGDGTDPKELAPFAVDFIELEALK